MKNKKIINAMIFFIVFLFVTSISGCIEYSHLTIKGTITKMVLYPNQDDKNNDDIVIIFFNNNSDGKKFWKKSIEKYNLKIGDDIILEMDNLIEPYNVVKMYYRYGEINLIDK